MPPYVIIGTGVAGISAAESIRTIDEQNQIVIIGDDPFGYYSRPGLAYMLTGEVPEKQLYPFDKEYFQRLKVTMVHAEVVRIEPQFKRIILSDGRKIRYRKLLIATGATAIQPQIPGLDLQGVVKLDDMGDARRFLKLARKARSAVVIGGGVTALELVEGCLNRRLKAHYLLRGDQYWGNVLDQVESNIVLDRLVEEGVHIHSRTEVEEILGKKGRVAAVRTKKGEIINCQLLAYAIGVRPRMRLATEAGLNTDRGILVNEHLQTSISDIFAAGDAAQVYDPSTGEAMLDSLWEPAKLQGRAAGINMAGGRKRYLKSVPFNATRLAGLTTMIIGQVGHGEDMDLVGIARGDSETWRQLPDAITAQSNFDVNRLRVLVGEDQLHGAVVMGDQTLSYPLKEIIIQGEKITSIRQRFFDPSETVGGVLSDFWISLRKKFAEQ